MNEETIPIIPDNIRFKLSEDSIDKIHSTPYEFGYPESEFGRVVFERTYARIKENGERETWHDIVIRCIEGVFTIRKWWYAKNKIKWQEKAMQKLALDMAVSMTQMKWLPPGRGLWAMGTDFVYESGSAPLYNCSLITINKLEEDCTWLMSMLMHGIGVGFVIGDTKQKIVHPNKSTKELYKIEDSREGWVESVKRLIQCYTSNKPIIEFDYSAIRKQGEPLRRFGGTACLTGDTIVYKDRKKNKDYNSITLNELYNMEISGKRLYTNEHIEPFHFHKIHLMSLHEDNGTFFRNKLIGIVNNGVADVYEIKTTNGYCIKATANHKFLDANGNYKELKCFFVNDKIGVNGSKKRKTGICTDCGMPCSRRAIRCRQCADKNQCSKYHQQLHVLEDSFGNSYKHKYLSFDTIASIKYAGKQEVFDVIMNGENHNFVANGFISHNSGPDPLEQLHKRLHNYLTRYLQEDTYTKTRLITDICNAIGAAVVAGSSRRSAQIAIADIDNKEDFLNLKNYEKYPERAEIGWLSNNSVRLWTKEDFLKIPEICEQILTNGEPGIINMINLRKYGRIGEEKEDDVDGTNPCLTGDTIVACADGKGHRTIKELADQDIDVPVYCLDDFGKLSISTMRHPRLTGKNKAIIEITLENGHRIKCTRNHKLRLKDGTYVEAIKLRTGDRLHIIKRFEASLKDLFPEANSRSSNYVFINNGLKSNTAEHRMIYEFYNKKIEKGFLIHHKDYNSLNNDIINLECMTKKDHDLLHSQNMLGDKNPMRRAKNEWNREKWVEYKTKMSKKTSGFGNGKSYKITNEELIEHARLLCKRLGYLPFVREWQEYAELNNLPQNISNWRRQYFGNGLRQLLEMGFLRANINLHKTKQKIMDTNTSRTMKKAIEMGYKCEVTDNKVFVQKKCESCNKNFFALFSRRERSFCSIQCANKKINSDTEIRQKMNIGIRKTFNKIKRKRAKLQTEIYYSLKDKLGRIPRKFEWEEECKKNKLAIRFGPISPFLGYGDLKKYCETQNHKIINIRHIPNEDVYTGTVDKYHNFFIGGFYEPQENNKNQWVYVNNLQCGEVPLSGQGEVCNIAEIVPIKCKTKQEFLDCCHYATFYCSTVSLLPTHSPRTNKIVAKNRRIGVSITGISQWIETYGMVQCIRFMRDGYKEIKRKNKFYNKQARIPVSVRLTCVKPSGSLGSLLGVSNGIHWPLYRYAIRRIIINESDKLFEILHEAGYKHEPTKYNPGTHIFEFPIYLGKARQSTQVTAWEQFAMLATLQREWADNAVSATITIKESERDDLQYMLAQFLPVIKTVSILPQSDKIYEQMPYEKITKEEYNLRIKQLKPINWAKLTSCESDASASFYCESDKCELPNTIKEPPNDK